MEEGRTFKDEIQVAGKRRLIRIEWKNNLGTYALFFKRLMRLKLREVCCFMLHSAVANFIATNLATLHSISNQIK